MGRSSEEIVDLDAARREVDNKPVPFKLRGRKWELPPQLPAAVFDPLVEGDLDDVIAMIVEFFDENDVDEAIKDKEFTKALVNRVRSNPHLVSQLLGGMRGVFEELLGEDQWAEWVRMRPWLTDYVDVAKLAFRVYGISLGEALGLSRSSGTGGETSSQTSPPAASTRAASGSKAKTRR